MHVKAMCSVHQNMRRATHVFGSWSGGAPFRWKIPSINTPFFPVHFIKKFPCSKNISRCTREIKLERPIFTSTSPLLLFRPIVIFCCLIVYSMSLPSNRAIASPLLSRLHCTLDGLAGADFRANNAKASLFEGWFIPDIARAHRSKMAAREKENKLAGVYIELWPRMHRAECLQQRAVVCTNVSVTYFCSLCVHSIFLNVFVRKNTCPFHDICICYVCISAVIKNKK